MASDTPANHLDIYMEVTILNKTWTVRGFKAIGELADWLNENGEEYAMQPTLTGPSGDAEVPGPAPSPVAPDVPDTRAP